MWGGPTRSLLFGDPRSQPPILRLRGHLTDFPVLPVANIESAGPVEPRDLPTETRLIAVLALHRLQHKPDQPNPRLIPHPGSQAPAWEPRDSGRLTHNQRFPSRSLGTRGSAFRRVGRILAHQGRQVLSSLELQDSAPCIGPAVMHIDGFARIRSVTGNPSQFLPLHLQTN